MVSEPVTAPLDVFLSPDHVAGVVIEEQVYQGCFGISFGAQEHIFAVAPALTGSESDFPAYKYPVSSCITKHER